MVVVDGWVWFIWWWHDGPCWSMMVSSWCLMIDGLWWPMVVHDVWWLMRIVDSHEWSNLTVATDVQFRLPNDDHWWLIRAWQCFIMASKVDLMDNTDARIVQATASGCNVQFPMLMPWVKRSVWCRELPSKGKHHQNNGGSPQPTAISVSHRDGKQMADPNKSNTKCQSISSKHNPLD